MRIDKLRFKTFPELHQYLALLEMMKIQPDEGIALLMSKGLGKTKVIIDWLHNFHFPTMHPVIVIAPKIAIPVWRHELRKHGILNELIIIYTYEKARILGANFFRVRNWNAAILDESTKIKNPRSQVTKTILQSFNHVPYRIIMSGRIRTNSDEDVWSQYHFLDNGKSFTSSFGFFKSHFFFLGYGFKWLLNPTYKSEFYGILKKKAIIFTNRFLEENTGTRLPRPITRNIFIKLSTQQRQMLHQLFNEFRIQIMKRKKRRTIYETNWRLALDSKARQICCGFLYTKTGTIRFDHPKIKALKQIMEDIDRNVVIFTTFKEEDETLSKIITSWYPKRLITLIKSGMSVDRIDMELTRHEGERNGILISNSAFAKYSISLTSTYYAIYYSRTYSLETHDQSKGRISRLTTRNPNVYYYNLIYRDSIEEVIHQSLKNNWSQSQYLNAAINSISP